jgi:hypothetical protein
MYSGRRLMGSRIMGSIGLWDQIYLICQIPNYHFLPNACLVDLLIRINRLLDTLYLCPKVIPLSGAHCIFKKMYIIVLLKSNEKSQGPPGWEKFGNASNP